MYICNLCGQEITSKGMGSHLKQKHNMTGKDYYDMFLKKQQDGVCLFCGQPTPFLKLSKGYQKHCSISCSQKDPTTRTKIEQTNMNRYGHVSLFQDPSFHQHVEKLAHTSKANKKKQQTCLKHYGVKNPAQSQDVRRKIEATNIKRYGTRAFNKEQGKKTMLDKYGYCHALQNPEIKARQEQTCIDKFGVSNVYSSPEMRKEINNKKHEEMLAFAKEHDCTPVIQLNEQYGTGWWQANIVELIKYKGVTYVLNQDIPTIIDYCQTPHTYFYSNIEKELVSFIETFYFDTIIENTKRIITPKELDIYLPDIHLAIEFNGTYWHSIGHNNKNKRYHLEKSLACREKGIRLIHIYEFEDFEQQKQLLKD